MQDRTLHVAVLLPFWVLRTVLILCWLILCSVAIYMYVRTGDGTESQLGYLGLDKQDPTTVEITLWVWLGLTAICWKIDIIASICYCCNHLSPGLFLMFSVIQSVLFTGVFVLQLIGYLRSHDNGTLAIVTIIWALFVGHLIYGCIMFYKDCKDTDKERGIYEKTPVNEIFPSGQLPSTYSVGGAHPATSEQPSHIHNMSGAIPVRNAQMANDRERYA